MPIHHVNEADATNIAALDEAITVLQSSGVEGAGGEVLPLLRLNRGREPPTGASTVKGPTSSHAGAFGGWCFYCKVKGR